MDSPFIFRGFPRLSILFYTIFHKKASQNQKGKDCLTILFLLGIIQQPYFSSNPSATASAKFSSTMLAQWSQMTAW